MTEWLSTEQHKMTQIILNWKFYLLQWLSAYKFVWKLTKTYDLKNLLWEILHKYYWAQRHFYLQILINRYLKCFLEMFKENLQVILS